MSNGLLFIIAATVTLSVSALVGGLYRRRLRIERRAGRKDVLNWQKGEA